MDKILLLSHLYKKYALNNSWINWLIFIMLSIIWGSSFILMKVGLTGLSAYQVASLRMISAGVVLLPFTIVSFRKIEAGKIKLVLLSGLLGSFFPAYLFCIAETKIDSSLAGILNALTPLFTILIGLIFFQLKITTKKMTGVIIGFIGLALLFFSKGNITFNYLGFAFLVLVATIFYGMNVNVVSRNLHATASLHIAALAFSSLIIPSLLILWLSNFFDLSFSPETMKAIGASVILGVLGTAIASIMFYVLVKRAGGVFASMVTYGIPFVAVGWGLLDGEKITPVQIGCLGIILAGVYLSNKKVKKVLPEMN